MRPPSGHPSLDWYVLSMNLLRCLFCSHQKGKRDGWVAAAKFQKTYKTQISSFLDSYLFLVLQIYSFLDSLYTPFRLWLSCGCRRGGWWQWSSKGTSGMHMKQINNCVSNVDKPCIVDFRGQPCFVNKPRWPSQIILSRIMIMNFRLREPIVG